MHDYTTLGSDVCGEHEYGHGTGANKIFGNIMQGISIVISNVKLEDINIHGAYGIAIWKDK